MDLRFHRIEAGTFLPLWSASVPLAIALGAQTYLSWRSLPPRRGSSAEGSDPDAPPRFRQMEETRVGRVQSIELVPSRGPEKVGRPHLLEFGEPERRESSRKDEESS